MADGAGEDRGADHVQRPENPFVTPVEMSKNRRGGPLFTPKTGLALGYQSGALEDMACFEDFLGAFQRQLHYQVEQMLGRIGEKIRQDETTTLTSPLVAGTFRDCLETGKDPLRGGGFGVYDYQLLSGTVTTAADSLRAVKSACLKRGIVPCPSCGKPWLPTLQARSPCGSGCSTPPSSAMGRHGWMSWLPGSPGCS